MFLLVKVSSLFTLASLERYNLATAFFIFTEVSLTIIFVETGVSIVLDALSWAWADVAIESNRIKVAKVFMFTLLIYAKNAVSPVTQNTIRLIAVILDDRTQRG